MRSKIVKFDKSIKLEKDQLYFVGLSGNKAIIKRVVGYDGKIPILEDLVGR